MYMYMKMKMFTFDYAYQENPPQCSTILPRQLPQVPPSRSANTGPPIEAP